MDFSKRSSSKELLDCDDIPFRDIEQNMKELNTINTLLGGHKITLTGFKKLIGNLKSISICELGCGGGDNLVVIKKWCNRKNIEVHLMGIDINPHCIEVAKRLIPDAQFLVSDYQYVNFENKKPDILFSSLFCHHFNEKELTSMLHWMNRNSKTGFFINDLHRHPFAYYSIKWITKLFSKSYLVKNDAPISVLRGFRKKEWKHLFMTSNLDHYVVKWKWAFRWLIIYSNIYKN